jgi:hypothetical protein
MEQQNNSNSGNFNPPNNFNPPPNAPNGSSTNQVMGIIGLVLGILALILSFIPCIGIWAVVPGLIGLVLSVVGMSMAGKSNGSKGLPIAGMVLSIIACGLAGYQWWAIKKFADTAKDSSYKFDSLINNLDTGKINATLKNLNININDSNANMSISTDSGKVNININETK